MVRTAGDAVDAAMSGAAAQQGLLASAFDRVPVAVVLIDRAGRIVMVNAQAELMFGRPRAQFEGDTIDMLVPVRYRAAHPAFRDSFVRAPQARPMGAGRDLFALRADGSEFPVEIGLNPIESDQGPMVLAAIVDITDRKQHERAVAAALREKELLLGEVHHRVKNNLQVVDGLLDLQSMRTDDARLSAILRDCQNRVRSMALIHQTLYQSRNFARVDFERFLASLVPMLVASHAAASARIALSMDVGAVALPISIAIPCGLVVNELVTNALKHGFAGERGGRLEVRLAHDGPDWAILEVANDGAPLPPGFSLAAPGGLGGTLVGLLARQVGGSVEVVPHAGACFRLRVPTGESS